jgi:hypothetical protein
VSRRVLLVLLAVVTVAVAGIAVVVVGGSGDGDDGPSAAPSTSATPPPIELSDVDTTVLPVARAEFCDRVADEAVVAALGGEPAAETSYDDGERTLVAGAFDDVAHEFGCSWTGRGTAARAWVFAPPVTLGAAQDLLRSARRAEGCEAQPAAAAYGAPSLALVCEQARGRVEASYRGLFGDAWLTCTLTGRLGPDALDRAEDWCVSVLAAARG